MNQQHNETATNRHQLWQQFKRCNDLEAKNSLIEIYYPLVDFVAGKMAIGLPKNVSKDDLISFGNLGLMDAVEKFDIDRGLQFETYASWRIRGAVIDGLRQGDWVPRSIREKARKVEDAYQKLEQQYMRSVSDKEMSGYLNITEQEFRQMLQDISVSTVFSLEDPIKEDETETRMSVIIDEKAKNPEAKVDEIYRKEALAKAIDRLTEKERTVVSLFYYEDLTLSEIAEVMSLTPSRISQLHTKAILRMKGVLQTSKSQLIGND